MFEARNVKLEMIALLKPADFELQISSFAF